MIKYPRTQHIQGSRLQPGDEDIDAVPFDSLRGKRLVVEEKVDGANAAVSFEDDGRLRLQSRGHYLRGGFRERHFALFKTWANRHQDTLRDRLQGRYIMFGEWLYAKHTVFYDGLPHYFLEFDVFDRNDECFLGTERRHELLEGLPVRSVPVLADARFERLEDLVALIGPSRFKTARWRESLDRTVEDLPHVRADRVQHETDPTDMMEGLYVKHEDDRAVMGRYKYIRPSFLQAVLDASGHWLDRPIVPNGLAEGVDLFSQEPT